jgi:hypothetical protein
MAWIHPHLDLMSGVSTRDRKLESAMPMHQKETVGGMDQQVSIPLVDFIMR